LDWLIKTKENEELESLYGKLDLKERSVSEEGRSYSQRLNKGLKMLISQKSGEQL